MNMLPSAIIKVSWKTGANASPFEGPDAAIGGTIGTAFTTSSGDTLTASHNLDRLWQPHDGFDDYDVWVAHPDGSVHIVGIDAVEHFSGFDIARVKCPESPVKFNTSSMDYRDVSEGQCIGYESSKAPFRCAVINNRITIEQVEIHQALLPLTPQPLEKKVLEINAADVWIDGKRGYALKQNATIGLSGGPMIDPNDGKVFAVCCIGLPMDKHHKEYIGAVDLRDLPLLNFS
jgi:hypothetical protein